MSARFTALMSSRPALLRETLTLAMTLAGACLMVKGEESPWMLPLLSALQETLTK